MADEKNLIETEKKQIVGGRFVSGRSGNPAGRSLGSKGRVRLQSLLEGFWAGDCRKMPGDGLVGRRMGIAA